MVWTANLAYIVGLIASDGCLSKDGRHIDFTSKDLQQINNFRKILKLKNKIGTKNSGTNNKHVYYRVQFGNKIFYKFLLGIGITQNKSKSIGALDIPDNFFIDFLRGDLDGDGYTYSFWDRVFKKSFRFYMGFSSGSRTYLNWLQRKTKILSGVKGTIGACNGGFQLRYAKKEAQILADKIYYDSSLICLRRKRFKIEKALGIIEDSRRAGVLKSVYRHG